MSSFQKIAADAAFKNRASRGFFVSLSSKVFIDSQSLARNPAAMAGRRRAPPHRGVYVTQVEGGTIPL